MSDLKKENAQILEKYSNFQRGDSQKMLEMTEERHRLYYKYEKIAKAQGDLLGELFISSMREDVFLQIMIYKVKVDVEGDIAKIFSRLDALETKIQNLERKQ